MDKPIAWIKARELTYMKAVVEHGATEWKTNLGLKPEDGDVPLYIAPPQREWQGLTENEISRKPPTQDLSAPLTVNGVPMYPQREWQGLTENEIKHLWYEACQTNLELTSQLIVHLARNIEQALKEKNT